MNLTDSESDGELRLFMGFSGMTYGKTGILAENRPPEPRDRLAFPGVNG